MTHIYTTKMKPNIILIIICYHSKTIASFSSLIYKNSNPPLQSSILNIVTVAYSVSHPQNYRSLHHYHNHHLSSLSIRMTSKSVLLLLLLLSLSLIYYYLIGKSLRKINSNRFISCFMDQKIIRIIKISTLTFVPPTGTFDLIFYNST